MKRTPEIKLIFAESESESSQTSNSIDEGEIDNKSEYEKISVNNRKLKKEVFGSLMEFKRSSRQYINESFASNQLDSHFVEISSPQIENKTLATKKDNLKYISTMLQLYNELQNATNELATAKEKILNTDEEALELHLRLRDIESEINSKITMKEPNCQCDLW